MAPLESRTVPNIVPNVDCALAIEAINNRQAETGRISRFILLNKFPFRSNLRTVTINGIYFFVVTLRTAMYYSFSAYSFDRVESRTTSRVV